MSALHVVVRPRPAKVPSAALAPVHGLFDLVVDGVNLTARIGSGQALAVLAELGQAVASLASGRRDRVTLQLYADDEAWELGLEADASDVLVYHCLDLDQPVAAGLAREEALLSRVRDRGPPGADSA